MTFLANERCNRVWAGSSKGMAQSSTWPMLEEYPVLYRVMWRTGCE